MKSPFASPFKLCINKDEVANSVIPQHVEEKAEDKINVILQMLKKRDMSSYLRKKLKVPHPIGQLDKQVSDSITYEIKRTGRAPEVPRISYSPDVGIIGSQRRVRFAACVKCK